MYDWFCIGAPCPVLDRYSCCDYLRFRCLNTTTAAATRSSWARVLVVALLSDIVRGREAARREPRQGSKRLDRPLLGLINSYVHPHRGIISRG